MNIKSEKLHNRVQVVGLVAVIASLVFVGLQLRQSQEIAIASQYQARFDAASEHYTAILESDQGLRVIGVDILSDITSNKALPPEFVTWAKKQPVEALAFRVVSAIIFLKNHDNLYFQYQAGFLSEEAWRALREQLKIGLKDPRTWTRSVFEKDRSVWRDSYRLLIQKLLDEENS